MAQLKQPETPYGNYYGHNAWLDEASKTDTSLSSTIQKQFWSSDDDDEDEDLLHIVARKAKARSALSPICIPESSFATVDSRRAYQPVPIVIVAVGRTGEGKSSLLNDIAGNLAFDAKMAVKRFLGAGTYPIILPRRFITYIRHKIDLKNGLYLLYRQLRPYEREREHFGCHVRIVDTPGFKDSEGRDAELLNKTKRAVMDLACDTGGDGGVNVILVVFKIYATSDLVMTTLQTLRILMHPITDFWPSVVLIFTHADYGNYESYRENKFCLHEEVTPRIREEFQLQEDLPMLFLSTKQHVCQYTRGAGECDCKRANKYHADCRRRLYEQIWNRRLVKLSLNLSIIDASIKPDAHELISTMEVKSNNEKISKTAIDVEPGAISATNDILVQPCPSASSTFSINGVYLSSNESLGNLDSIGLLARTFH
ncbi:hypothetical protein BC937DRAFT_90549 [Endogone sp. FLAS-F59071]|nr:hypothetical protein BC937DRAFT_90549 [Endogone sp. FLAS-F59071]|eukprot:RUS16999.1 hypothetical protein BC937DRAFT_90549 [Endogone sp. FLAS-F59071]